MINSDGYIESCVEKFYYSVNHEVFLLTGQEHFGRKAYVHVVPVSESQLGDLFNKMSAKNAAIGQADQASTFDIKAADGHLVVKDLIAGTVTTYNTSTYKMSFGELPPKKR